MIVRTQSALEHTTDPRAVIEDARQALLAHYSSVPVGSAVDARPLSERDPDAMTVKIVNTLWGTALGFIQRRATLEALRLALYDPTTLPRPGRGRGPRPLWPHKGPDYAAEDECRGLDYRLWAIPGYADGSGNDRFMRTMVHALIDGRARVFDGDRSRDPVRQVTLDLYEEIAGLNERYGDGNVRQRSAQATFLDRTAQLNNVDMTGGSTRDACDSALHIFRVWPHAIAAAVGALDALGQRELAPRISSSADLQRLLWSCTEALAVPISLRRPKFEHLFVSPKAQNPMRPDAIRVMFRSDGSPAVRWADPALQRGAWSPPGNCPAFPPLPGMNRDERATIARCAEVGRLHAAEARSPIDADTGRSDVLTDPGIALSTGQALLYLACLHAPLLWEDDPTVDALIDMEDGRSWTLAEELTPYSSAPALAEVVDLRDILDLTGSPADR